MPVSKKPLDVSQPGLSEALEAVRATWREGTYEVPGLGYTLKARPETPGQLINLQTDGIGDKALLHTEQGTYRAAAVDALAMSLNDAALVKSRVSMVLDYLSVPTDEPGPKVEFVRALAEECERRDIEILGGELATLLRHDEIHPVVMTYGETSYVGDQPIEKFVAGLNHLREGDVLIGLASSGIHANGTSVARDVLERHGELLDHLGELTAPTEIYYDRLVPLYDEIGGMMHITQGGFSKLAKVLPIGLLARIEQSDDLLPQELFHRVRELGELPDAEMYERFNNGVGFILSVRPERIESVLAALGAGAHLLGWVESGDGRVSVRSAYTGQDVVFGQR